MGAESVLTNLQTTGLSDLSPEMKTFYHRKLLSRLKPNLVHTQFGQKVKIPKNNGKTVEFRRFQPLGQASVPATTLDGYTPATYTNNQFQLTEGVTPGGQNMKVTSLTATVSQHGSYIAISDVLELTAFDPVLDQASELLGDQAGEYVDLLVREVLVAGTNVFYAFAAKFNTDAELIRDTATAQPTARNQVNGTFPITVDSIRAAKRIMQRNKVKPYRGESTTPGKGEYVLIIHPDAVFDLQSNKKWIDVAVYTKDGQGAYSGEVGMIYGVRVVVTENAKVFTGAGAGSADVYAALLIGADAYGVVDVAGSGNVQYIFKAKGSGGTEDPLDQRSTSGWKCMFTTVILNQLALLRIEHGFKG